MRVGIITFHGADNYGAVLQAWATSKWFIKHGIQAEIIDYRPSSVGNRYKVFRTYSYKENPHRIVADCLSSYKRFKRKRNFHLFRNEVLPLTRKTYTSFKELEELCNSYDYYICGSDQIWNPEITNGLDPAYFLKFVKDNSKKIAFAPSIAINNLTDSRIKDIIEYINDFHALSLREKESVDSLQPYCAQNIYQINDPVFLHDARDFHDLELDIPIREPFVFMYIIGSAQNNDHIIRFAERVASINQCMLVYIIDGNSLLVHIHGKDVFGCKPQQFLTYIKKAQYIISNSFHATALSVIYQRPFYVFLKEGTGSRLTNILHEIGLGDRICSSLKDLDRLNSEIDYKTVSKKLDSIKDYSEEYLYSALNIKESKLFLRFDQASDKRRAIYQELKQAVDKDKGKYLVAIHRNKTVRSKSRSGGIFTALSDNILDNGGTVYGCKMDGFAKAIHVRTSTKAERNKLRGSKYIQSEMGDCYREVKDDLYSGKPVLFSGTSCQVAGLKAYLQGIDQSLLYTIDIVCHGVPSPKIWEAYLKWYEARFKKKTKAIKFRDKEFGWKNHFETIYIGKRRISSSIFRNLFYKHYILRPSCYICPFANLDRCSDITLGDAWGIQKTTSRFNDDKGCSLVMINSEHGRELFNNISEQIDVEEIIIDDYLQPNLKHPSYRPNDRDLFWDCFYKGGFSAIYNKYIASSNAAKFKEKLIMLYYYTINHL